jgi:signal peptidase I
MSGRMTKEVPAAKSNAPARGGRFGRRVWLALRVPGWIVAILIVLVGRSSLADHYEIPSGSMLPTVRIGDHVLVSKLAYGIRAPFLGFLDQFGGPRRGDVVVLESPENGIVLLKRVIAIPGDTVAVRGGKLWLNGEEVPVRADHGELRELLGSAHPISLDEGGGPNFGPTTIPDEKYLVLGDNRGDSRDGRFFGLVERRAIFGRALGVYWRKGKPAWQKL